MEIRISVLLLILAVDGSFAIWSDPERRFEDATLGGSSTTFVESTTGLSALTEKSSDPTDVLPFNSMQSKPTENARPVVTSTTVTVTVPPESASEAKTGLVIETKPSTEATTNTVTDNPQLVNKNKEVSAVVPNNPSLMTIPGSIVSYPNYYPRPPYAYQNRFQLFIAPATESQLPRLYPYLYSNFHLKPYDNSYNPLNTGNSNQGYIDRSFNIPNLYASSVNQRTPPYAYFYRPYNQPYDQPYNQPYDQPYNQPYDQPYNQLYNQPYNQPNPPVPSRANFDKDCSQSPLQSVPNYQNPYFNEQSTNDYPTRNFNQPSNVGVYRPSSETVPTNELSSTSPDASTTMAQKQPLIASFIRKNADQLANEVVSKYVNKYDTTSDVNVNDRSDQTTPDNDEPKQAFQVFANFEPSADTHLRQNTNGARVGDIIFPDNEPQYGPS